MCRSLRSAACFAPLFAAALAAPAAATPVGNLLISEVLFEPSGADDGREWVELVNIGSTAIDLSGYSLGWGQNSYSANSFVLPSALLAPGGTWVIGGPVSNGSNGNPVYDQVRNFNPNLGDGTSATQADVIALFFGNIATTPGLLPVHVVVYGRTTATTSVLNEQGTTAPIDFRTNGFSQGDSIAFDGSAWSALASPSPGASAVPEPGTLLMVSAGLLILAKVGRPRASHPSAPHP